MQGRHDDFEGRFVLESGVWVDGDAASVVAHNHGAVAGEFEVDCAGMPGHHLVHRIVQGFGHQMVQCRLVGAADKHAGAPPYRLQPFQDLDVLGRIAGLSRFDLALGCGSLFFRHRIRMVLGFQLTLVEKIGRWQHQ